MKKLLLLLLLAGCSAPIPERAVPRPPPRTIGAKVGGRTSPDGLEPINCDLPGRLHTKNVGGSDGAGLCVFCSAHHAGLWQGDPTFTEIFDWMKKHPGGGYPEKFDAMIKQCAKETGLPMPDYVQVEDNDYEILKLASANGLMPGVTYGYSPSGRYGGKRIAHMVSLAHATDKWVAILDNNYPGDSNYEWDTPSEFLSAYKSGDTHGWAVILLAKSPPPPPKGKQ